MIRSELVVDGSKRVNIQALNVEPDFSLTYYRCKLDATGNCDPAVSAR